MPRKKKSAWQRLSFMQRGLIIVAGVVAVLIASSYVGLLKTQLFTGPVPAVFVSYYDEASKSVLFRYDNRSNGQGVFSQGQDVPKNAASDQIGQFSKIALDNQQGVHVLSFDAKNNKLSYAVADTSSNYTKWTVTPLDTPATGGGGKRLAFVLDDAAHAHVAYVGNDGSLWYASDASGSWKHELVDQGRAVATNTNLAVQVDSSGNPRIAYFGAAGKNYLFEAVKNNGSWGKQSALEVQSTSGTVSLRLDANNYDYVVFTDPAAKKLSYAVYKPPRWSRVDIAQGNVGTYADFALDAQGYAQIAYQTGDGHVMFMTNNADDQSWLSEQLSGLPKVGDYLSVAVDQAGRLHATYYDATSNGLRYAYRRGVNDFFEGYVDVRGGSKYGTFGSLALFPAARAGSGIEVNGTPSPVNTPPPNNEPEGVHITNVSAPTTVSPMQQFTLTVTGQNNFHDPLYKQNVYAPRLQLDDPTAWGGVQFVDMQEAKVDSGGTVTFQGTLTAPGITRPDTVLKGTIIRQGMNGQVAWQGETINYTIDVEQSASSFTADCVEYKAPVMVKPGATFTTAFRYKNTGSSTWTNNDAYRVIATSQEPKDNYIWGQQRIELAEAFVAPGETGTFYFTALAPSTVGMYNWRFQPGYVNGGNVIPFGTTCGRPIQVVAQPGSAFNDAQCISINSNSGGNSAALAGTTFQVSMDVKNTGNTTWYRNTTNETFLAPIQTDLWGSGLHYNRLKLPKDTVQPGETVSFLVTLTAPQKPGRYHLAFGMLQDYIEWFGSSAGACAGNDTFTVYPGSD